MAESVMAGEHTLCDGDQREVLSYGNVVEHRVVDLKSPCKRAEACQQA